MLTMHQWRSAQLRCFVPPGKQLFVEVVFHTPSTDNEVRIHDHPHVHQGSLGAFSSAEEERAEWESPPNEGTATQVFFIEPRFRDPAKGANAPWLHFHDERAPAPRLAAPTIERSTPLLQNGEVHLQSSERSAAYPRRTTSGKRRCLRSQ